MKKTAYLFGMIFLLEYNSDVLKTMVQYPRMKALFILAYNKLYI